MTNQPTNLHGMVDGVGRLQRRNQALRARQELKGLQRLHVRYGGIVCPSAVLEPRVLRPHPRVVQPGGNGVRFRNLSVLVLRRSGPHTNRQVHQNLVGKGCRECGRNVTTGGMEWDGMVWYSVVWCGIVWYGMIRGSCNRP